jgi:hypothetical protein
LKTYSYSCGHRETIYADLKPMDVIYCNFSGTNVQVSKELVEA